MIISTLPVLRVAKPHPAHATSTPQFSLMLQATVDPLAIIANEANNPNNSKPINNGSTMVPQIGIMAEYAVSSCDMGYSVLGISMCRQRTLNWFSHSAEQIGSARRAFQNLSAF